MNSEDARAASQDIAPSLGESSTAGTRLALLILGHRLSWNWMRMSKPAYLHRRHPACGGGDGDLELAAAREHLPWSWPPGRRLIPASSL